MSNRKKWLTGDPSDLFFVEILEELQAKGINLEQSCAEIVYDHFCTNVLHIMEVAGVNFAGMQEIDVLHPDKSPYVVVERVTGISINTPLRASAEEIWLALRMGSQTIAIALNLSFNRMFQQLQESSV